MNEHLINKAADWFDDVEKWKSFQELCEAKASIEGRWLERATDELRRHFVVSPSAGWDFSAWGCGWDTWWCLNEFGPDSVGIGFGWKYRRCFGARGNRVNRALLKSKLLDQQYSPLVAAFGDFHERGPEGFELVENRGFAFGSPCDGHMSESEFAWYAWHHKASFVQQAVGKIEAYTRNPEITKLLAQLNRETLNS